jgi:hypothetical protein
MSGTSRQRKTDSGVLVTVSVVSRREIPIFKARRFFNTDRGVFALHPSLFGLPLINIEGFAREAFGGQAGKEIMEGVLLSRQIGKTICDLVGGENDRGKTTADIKSMQALIVNREQ